MPLDAALCYRALLARDARFDGRFFVGVTSTGVFCRPICRVRPPRLANCRFFGSAAAAHAAGFRPCLRCQPEAAPHSPRWRGSSAAVQRALRLLAESPLAPGGVSQLAARVGVGERQLRRLFRRHLGAGVLAVAQTQRLLLAKQLIDGTDLPLEQLALAAGYGSPRRLREALRRSYGRSARELRRTRRRGVTAPGPAIELQLGACAPFDWPALLEFLAPRAIPGVEEVSGANYRRVIEWAGAVGFLEAAPDPRAGACGLRVRLQLPGGSPLLPVALRLRELFDLDADCAAIERDLAADPLLRPLVRRHSGLRLPGAWDPFELLVRAVLGQQVSVRAASTLAGRVAEKFGRALRSELPGSALRTAFPAPEALAQAPLEAVGVTRARADAIRELARRMSGGAWRPEPHADAAQLAAELTSIRGIGAWTAGYAAMRLARDPDAFLPTDLHVRRALERAGDGTAAQRLARAERWRPWRAYAVIYLWRSGAGALPER